MKNRKSRSFVVGISAVTGGGKTAVATRLAELLQDAITLCFDDYDDTNIHPEHLQIWLAEGADYNVWETPVLTDHLRSLTAGNPVTSPVDGSEVLPAKHIVFDAPLGRAHLDTGQFIDLMVFIDTPLDVAMARRLLRDNPSVSTRNAEEPVRGLSADLSSYLERGRGLYLEHQKQIRRDCDLVLDGCLTVDELAATIDAEVTSLIKQLAG